MDVGAERTTSDRIWFEGPNVRKKKAERKESSEARSHAAAGDHASPTCIGWRTDGEGEWEEEKKNML